MLRLYCPALASVISSSAGAMTPTDVPLDEAEAHHARRVLRLEMGAPVEVFDGLGHIGAGRLLTAGGSSAESRAPGFADKKRKGDPTPRSTSVRIERCWTEPPLRPAIAVATAIPKGSRADTMVEQLSQVGADRLIPLISQRTVVEPGDGKLERFERAAIESAKQCGRARVMTVVQASRLTELLQQQADLKLFASLRGSAPSADTISGHLKDAASVLMIIGPEGGWTDDEEQQARQAGCVPWRIGPHVLRIEAAAVVAVAIARYLTLE